jgi:hypothetical protein
LFFETIIENYSPGARPGNIWSYLGIDSVIASISIDR